MKPAPVALAGFLNGAPVVITLPSGERARFQYLDGELRRHPGGSPPAVALTREQAMTWFERMSDGEVSA